MDQAPPAAVFRKLVTSAFEPDELGRFCQDHDPFNDLIHRFGPNDGILDMADEVWKYVKMFWLWDEFFDAVAGTNPRVFNRYAADLGLSSVEVQATPRKVKQEKPQPPMEERVPKAPPATGQFPYVDFKVHVTSGEDGSYPVYASSALAGEAKGMLQLPWTDGDLRDMAKQLESLDTERQDLVDIGDRLFKALLQDDVRDRYSRSVAQIKEGSRLRLRLQLDPPELRALPWELLYDASQDEFLALSGKVLITRYLATGKPTPRLDVALPLVVLVVAASPVDVAPELDVEAEVAAVKAALSALEQKGLVRVATLSHGEMWSLRKALRDHDPEVLHFVMHGDVGPQGGELMLEGEDGRVEPLPASKLSLLLRRTRVRLAVVNACLSARDEAVEPGPLHQRRQAVMGVGPTLLDEAGLGAVVANQFSVDDEAAKLFARDFYETLARFEPLDEAVSRAREALVLEYDKGAREWATPVLFLRAPDGILFSLVGDQAPIPVAQAPRPSSPAQSPDLETVRRQLHRRFDDPGLDAVCLDHFPQVYDRFGRGMRRDEKVTLLLDHCRRDPVEWARLQQVLAG